MGVEQSQLVILSRYSHIQVTTIDQEIVKLEKEIAEIQGKVQTGHNSVAAAASSRGIGRGGRKAGRTAVQPMEEMPLQPPPLVPPVVPIPAIPAHFVPFTFHFPGRPAFTVCYPLQQALVLSTDITRLFVAHPSCMIPFLVLLGVPSWRLLRAWLHAS